MEHVQNPRFRGPLMSGLYGVEGVPGDGLYVEIWVKTDSGTVVDAAFRTPGCPSSTAAASVLCQMIITRDVARVLSFTAEDLLGVLGGLPEGKEMYANMSIGAMLKALQVGSNA